jgi:hypothetical protein
VIPGVKRPGRAAHYSSPSNAQVKSTLLLILLILFNNFKPHYGPWIDPASNRNEYQESSWG